MIYYIMQEQDPVIMGKTVVESSKNALGIRYRFLPYLYTLFFRAHKFGETVIRPLFFEYISIFHIIYNIIYIQYILHII